MPHSIEQVVHEQHGNTSGPSAGQRRRNADILTETLPVRRQEGNAGSSPLRGVKRTMWKKAVQNGTVLGLLVIATTARAQDAASEIARIEKQPRAGRVASYETLANRKGFSEKDRLTVIAAFAGHARNLSPHYGRGTSPIDVERWRAMLAWGHEQDPRNRDIAAALIQLLLDDGKTADAAPIAKTFLKESPDDHAAKAWDQWCSRKGKGAPPPLRKFPLHFCVLTRNPEAAKRATREQCVKETAIFNESFRTLARAPLVEFVFQGYSPYAEIRNSKSELVQWGDRQKPYDSGQVLKAFNTCDDAKVRDRGAINVYIVDSYAPRAGFDDKTSHGVRNSNRPYLFIDWERLGSNIQNAEPHEMGHAFGLDHVGVIGAKGTTSTNIMASAAEGFGSGGERDLGFTDSQAALILYHAERTADRLGLGR